MTGPLPCDHCRGIDFNVFVRGPFPTTLVLECKGCRARTGCRIAAPIMADAS